MGNPITTQSMEGIFQHTDAYISITILDESLNFLRDYKVYPPNPFDGIRVYDFELFSAGYMVSGMVRDGDEWYIWIGRLNNDFELTHSFVGSADTGSFGLTAPSCDQMGGCVTEAGHFFAAGAAYLSSGHTNYDVMYRPFFPENLSDGSEITAGIPLPASEAGLSVTRVSISGPFVFRYRGDDAEAVGAEVIDIMGRCVRTLDGVQTSTEEVYFDFDGRGNDGNPLPSGAYVVTASTGQSFDSATFAIVR